MKKYIILACLTFIFATEGPKSPATTVDDATVGSITWTTPNNSQSSDNSYATAALTLVSPLSHYIKATNFSFTAVTGTVDGITVGVERKAANVDNASDYRVRIVKGGTIGATDKSTGSFYETSDTYENHGGAADKWGETWTATDITASNFGVAFASQVPADGVASVVSVDHIRITVNYTVSSVTRRYLISWNGIYTWEETIYEHKQETRERSYQ